MVMVEGNKVRELAEFAVGGIVRNVVPTAAFSGMRVPDMVLGEAAGSVVVAMKEGGIALWKAESIEELAEEAGLMRGVV